MSVGLNFENAVWLRVMNDHLKVLDERLAESEVDDEDSSELPWSQLQLQSMVRSQGGLPNFQ